MQLRIAERSSVRITARAPGHGFSVAGGALSGSIELGDQALVAIDVALELASLEAPDPLGQMQLSKLLDLPKKPVAKATLSAPIPLEGGAGKGRARIAIGARSAEVEIDGRASAQEARARFSIRFSALGYEPPKLLFLRVKDELEVEVTLRLQPA